MAIELFVDSTVRRLDVPQQKTCYDIQLLLRNTNSWFESRCNKHFNMKRSITNGYHQEIITILLTKQQEITILEQ
jgi:hypothetical protein